MTTTMLKISKANSDREEALAALQEGGIGVIEVANWEDAAMALARAISSLAGQKRKRLEQWKELART